MTKQEIFDKVWDYFFVKKNPPGVDTLGNCIYAGERDGVVVHCAVGCLLGDATWVRQLWGPLGDAIDHNTKVVDAIFGDEFDTADVVTDPRFHMLRQMQEAHDRAASSRDFRYEVGHEHEFRRRFATDLWTVAKAFDLVIPDAGGTFDANGKFTPAE